MYKGGGRKGFARTKKRRKRKTCRKFVSSKKGNACLVVCFFLVAMYLILFMAFAIVIIKDVQKHIQQKAQVIQNIINN